MHLINCNQKEEWARGKTDSGEKVREWKGKEGWMCVHFFNTFGDVVDVDVGDERERASERSSHVSLSYLMFFFSPKEELQCESASASNPSLICM